jgi:signal recognition particle GTPase
MIQLAEQLATACGANGAVMVVGVPGSGKVTYAQEAAKLLTGREPKMVALGWFEANYLPVLVNGAIRQVSDLGCALDVHVGEPVVLHEVEQITANRAEHVWLEVSKLLEKNQNPVFLCVVNPESVPEQIRNQFATFKMRVS